MTNIFCGIDNGLSGAVVLLSSESGVAPIATLPMPLLSFGKGKEVDIAALDSWLCQFDTTTMFAALETPGKHSPGTMALCSMWDSYGAIRSLLTLRNIRHTRVAPRTWQKVMIPNCERGQTKRYALSIASKLWPKEKWLRTSRSRMPDNNIIDAALIAHWCRMKHYE